MIEILQIVTTDTSPIFVLPLIGYLALGLVIIGIIVFYRSRRSRNESLGQEDSWLQE
ncbi:MAG: hypothetical protein KAW94_01915 [Candidatus Thorarchaeota archaeon]|nr:hypothetical protein [Candidatus Thorarchaeota archaeon]